MKTKHSKLASIAFISSQEKKVMVKGRMIQKSINGVQTRNSVSAMVIGLSGLATILFNQTFLHTQSIQY
ncbi:hypothetical protein BDF21DRAFT_424774 [Thamnidium elegans]|nr:hypothetical protein BDF21DRAFT_424774 [Thamnidium elegans]